MSYKPRNTNKWKPKTAKSWKGGKGYKSYTPKPVTEFSRPSSEDFTVSGTTGFPDVILSAMAHSKMLALVKNCSIEIGWVSPVIRDSRGNFVIQDVYVPLQQCSSATTVITEDGDAQMMEELLLTGRAKELNRIRCWGHSHVNMGVSPSGVDETQTDDFVNRFDDFFIRLIGNKRGDLMCHVYLIDQGIILNNPKIIVLKGKEDYKEWAINEIKTKVTREVWVNRVGFHGAGAHLGDYGDYDDDYYHAGVYGGNNGAYASYDPLGDKDDSSPREGQPYNDGEVFSHEDVDTQADIIAVFGSADEDDLIDLGQPDDPYDTDWSKDGWYRSGDLG